MQLNDKIRILIAEDDVFIAESLMLTLRGLGYEVAEPCVTPEEALQLLSMQSFDLALLDIQFFGKEEGISLGKTIATQYEIPFIFLTAFSDAETISNASTAGPSAYLVKPATPSTLFATIQTALYNFHSRTGATNASPSAPPNTFFIKLNSKLYRVDWEHVVSIESGKNYALIKSSDSKLPPLPLRGSLQQIMQLVPPSLSSQFVQINRGCCVNVRFITRIEKEQVITSIQEYPVGESYTKQLLEQLRILK